ncbi:hypothetical protein BBJ28_00005558 [Nothophytophthora sp. Chile5]|nr:hypothetical protein BBJ28_00005558 [Nothophytophthora sp. Chile5]
MKVFSTAAALGAVVAALVYSAQAEDVVPAEVGTTEFEQFRPVFHFLARDNWMNDPCAPYYDEETALYHMFYQSNPKSTEWGNMTWGHAVSEDQVTWSDYPDSLLPLEDEWDNLGVFSGFAMNNAIDGKHTVFYTGVTALPISWKLEYLFGEHVNYATTSDGGKTWQKGSQPLIELPPTGLNVTGWRDPNVFHSTALDAHYGYDAEAGSNYLLVAGGIHDVGPRIFLYHAEDYENWTYQGYLLSKEKNTTFSEYSGSWGFNFETTIYREMTDEDGETHNVMLFAAEGSPDRYPMWATGTFGSGAGCGVETDPEEGLFSPLMVGVTDRSDWYANSIYTDKSGKDVLIGWITEDNGFTGAQPQGWNGMLSVPREVGVTILRNIHDVDDHLVGQGDWIVSDVADVTCTDGSTLQAKTIKTLGQKPLSDLELLRNEDAYEQVDSVTIKAASVLLNTTATSFELIAEVSAFERGSQVGFEVRRSSAGDEVTTVLYDDELKKVLIDRSSSSSADCAPFTTYDTPPATDTIWGYFYLYDLLTGANKADTCEVARETLRFHVFVDVSSIEVFVNDRFALSARIYPCASQSNSDGIALVASADATFENVQVWSDPKHAWTDEREVPTF